MSAGNVSGPPPATTFCSTFQPTVVAGLSPRYNSPKFKIKKARGMYSSKVKPMAFAIFLVVAQGPAVRPVGTIQAIQGNALTLKPDSGSEVNVQVPDSTSIVRVAPGQTDLKGAT